MEKLQYALFSMKNVTKNTKTENGFIQIHTFALSTGFADWRKGRFELREKKL